MSSNNFFKKSFFKTPVLFRFAQKHSLDCALTKSVRTTSNLNNSKTTKEQVKEE